MPFIYDYPRPMVTVDAILFYRNFDQLEVLLIQRKHNPYQGLWAFPGGFVELEEDLDQAVARELQEETGLENIPVEQLKTYGALDRDPRGRCISVVYYGFVQGEKPEVNGSDDALRARWFVIGSLPDLAFDHRLILEDALNKIGYNRMDLNPDFIWQ